MEGGEWRVEGTSQHLAPRRCPRLGSNDHGGWHPRHFGLKKYQRHDYQKNSENLRRADQWMAGSKGVVGGASWVAGKEDKETGMGREIRASTKPTRQRGPMGVCRSCLPSGTRTIETRDPPQHYQLYDYQKLEARRAMTPQQKASKRHQEGPGTKSSCSRIVHGDFGAEKLRHRAGRHDLTARSGDQGFDDLLARALGDEMH